MERMEVRSILSISRIPVLGRPFAGRVRVIMGFTERPPARTVNMQASGAGTPASAPVSQEQPPGSNNIGVYGAGSGSGAGVYGFNVSAYGGAGVLGSSSSGPGVKGVSPSNGYGVHGESSSGTAAYFKSNTGHGLVVENGNVGIGTTNPTHKLHVVGSGPRMLIETTDGYNPEVNFASSGTDNWAIYKHTVTGDLRFYQYGDRFVIQNSTGNVGLGTVSPSQKLTVRGNIAVQSATTGATVIELGEGLDYAEGFNVSDRTNVGPGSVLIIDPDNAGKLKLSRKSYDTKVAGIVAGGKGLDSAVRLGAGQFDHDVALAGRVYCNVDGTYGKVSPGDLLTTSPTPGYAMVADDAVRAQGAILGKAMEKLERGRRGRS